MTHSVPDPVQTDIPEDDEHAALRVAVSEQEPVSPPPLMAEAEPIEAGPRRRLLVSIAAAVVVILLWMLFRTGPRQGAGSPGEGGENDAAVVESMANEGDPSWMRAVDTTARASASAGAVVPPVYAPAGAAGPAPQQAGSAPDSAAGPGAPTPPAAAASSAAAPTEDPRRQSFLAALRSKPLQSAASFPADPNPAQTADEIPLPPSLEEMEAAAQAEAARRSVPPAGFAVAGMPAVTPAQAELGGVVAGASSRSSYVTGGAGPAPQQAPYVMTPQGAAGPAGSVVVPVGTVIEGQLHTAINSEVPGSVMGMVTRNVYDAAQRVVVIPRYSWLFGTYESDVAAGQARLVVQWTAVRFPAGETYALPALRAGDLTGASGLPARVDNHYGRVFGQAILSSIIAAGFQSSGGGGEPRSRRDALAEATAQHLGQTAAEVTRRNLDIKPTLRRLHMTRFLIIVDRDLVFTPPARR